MAWINAVLREVFDLLLYPFRTLPAWVGLTVVSLFVAVGMLLVFKKVSNQEALAEVKRKIHACLFEMRLFNDDFLAIFRAQMEILRHNATYFRLNLPPLFWMIVPLVLVVAQLQFHYGYRGLEPGEAALLEVQLREGWQDDLPAASDKPVVSLETSPGIAVETPPVWSAERRELTWRLRAREAGPQEARVRLGGESYAKSVEVSDQVVRRSPVRVSPGFLDELIYPAEPPIPEGSPVEQMRLAYPDATVSLLGWHTHWLVFFFVVSIVFAFALRNRFGVTI